MRCPTHEDVLGEEPPAPEKGGKRCASAIWPLSRDPLCWEEEPQLSGLGAIFFLAAIPPTPEWKSRDYS